MGFHAQLALRGVYIFLPVPASVSLYATLPSQSPPLTSNNLKYTHNGAEDFNPPGGVPVVRVPRVQRRLSGDMLEQMTETDCRRAIRYADGHRSRNQGNYGDLQCHHGGGAPGLLHGMPP
ncbi:unnamed protein product [Pleuronectes platessa]|uniref:Uncharacterized protein n=1 Tax=Pleuronectes platessa TaxID=8262 RepID=A0A9N7YU39_PLEPL|nr:unnamed protein product [Pleuronectes platessa]